MVGDTITITWGPEHYAVQNYSGFKVGPFTITTQVQPNETDKQAIYRAWKILDKHANALFLAQRNGYHERYQVR